jgi:hypothetical protein
MLTRYYFLYIFLSLIAIPAIAQEPFSDSTQHENKIDSTISTSNREAQFPGGITAWNQYILHHMEKNADALIWDGKSGGVVIAFTIDTTGKVNDVRQLPCMESKVRLCIEGKSRLAKLALKCIMNSPKWDPAIINGKPVVSIRKQPFSFYKQIK